MVGRYDADKFCIDYDHGLVESAIHDAFQLAEPGNEMRWPGLELNLVYDATSEVKTSPSCPGIR